jgi:hypothetical protein
VSDWWREFLDADAMADADADAKTAADADAKAGSRTEQTRKFKQMLREVLGENPTRDADLRLRRMAAYEVAQMANRAWTSKRHADRKRSRAHTAQRWASGGSAAVAAGSGGALAAGLGGATAKVVGITAFIIGIVAGATAAMLPETEYERNRGKARQYEQLWWDMWNYATLELPTIKADTISDQIKKFSAAIEAVGDE